MVSGSEFIIARDKGVMLHIHQLMVYPVAGSDMNTESYQKYAAAKPLDKPMMGSFIKNYLRDISQAKDPRISLVNANLKGLPATTIISAEIYPLQSEGAQLSDKLKAAGVSLNTELYKLVTHEFFGMAILVPQAKEAQAHASLNSKKHLINRS